MSIIDARDPFDRRGVVEYIEAFGIILIQKRFSRVKWLRSNGYDYNKRELRVLQKVCVWHRRRLAAFARRQRMLGTVSPGMTYPRSRFVMAVDSDREVSPGLQLREWTLSSGRRPKATLKGYPSRGLSVNPDGSLKSSTLFNLSMKGVEIPRPDVGRSMNVDTEVSEMPWLNDAEYDDHARKRNADREEKTRAERLKSALARRDERPLTVRGCFATVVQGGDQKSDLEHRGFVLERMYRHLGSLLCEHEWNKVPLYERDVFDEMRNEEEELHRVVGFQVEVGMLVHACWAAEVNRIGQFGSMVPCLKEGVLSGVSLLLEERSDFWRVVSTRTHPDLWRDYMEQPPKIGLNHPKFNDVDVNIGLAERSCSSRQAGATPRLDRHFDAPPKLTQLPAVSSSSTFDVGSLFGGSRTKPLSEIAREAREKLGSFHKV
jgi:hypothetical protein